MFSLLIGLNDGVVPEGRLFEFTDPSISEKFGSNTGSELDRLPALSMPEIKDDGSEQVAKIGTITLFKKAFKGHTFTFTPNPSLEPIASATIQNLARKLDIDPKSWEFTRTHWAIKDVDLFKVILEHQTEFHRGDSGNLPASGAVEFPVDEPRDSTLVAVMMPFASEFDVVYETIEKAVADVGLHCIRADDIWNHDHVMKEVTSLLWKSQIVVADLTGKNTNVFYETGLAHALPRPTVLLTQNQTDIPFDLSSIRYLKYGLGTESRQALRKQLSERLTTLVVQSKLSG